MTARNRLASDVALIALACVGVAVNAASAPHPVRVVLTLLAALSLPGWAVLTQLDVDGPLTALAIGVAVSLAIDTVTSLALVWTGWWHPVPISIALGIVCIAAIAYDIRRRREALHGEALSI